MVQALHDSVVTNLGGSEGELFNLCMISDSTNATACLVSELKRKQKISFKPKSWIALFLRQMTGKHPPVHPSSPDLSACFQIPLGAEINFRFVISKSLGGTTLCSHGKFALTNTRDLTQHYRRKQDVKDAFPAVIVSTYVSTFSPNLSSRRPSAAPIRGGALHPARFFSQPYQETEGLVALLVHLAGVWPIYGMWWYHHLFQRLGEATQALVLRGSCILPELISARQSLQKLFDSFSYFKHLATRNPLTSAWKKFRQTFIPTHIIRHVTVRHKHSKYAYIEWTTA